MAFMQKTEHSDIPELFKNSKSTEHGFLRVSAPMVRYSKLEFRKLLRKNSVDLCFTPMVVAESFNNSDKARKNEFTTCQDDRPLIAQFAAKDANEFSTAAQLIYPYVDGVDLNCGCPQSWAINKGYGVGLLRKPEVVQEIVRTVRRCLPQNFSISMKIRLLSSGITAGKSTVEFARQLEMCGITFLTVHGRTMWERSSAPLNVVALKEIKQSLSIPVIANGDIRNWNDALELHNKTGADGVMAARGLLSNPALYNHQSLKTPLECVQQWLDISAAAGNNMQFQSLHHHLTFMCGNGLIKRKERFNFSNLSKKNDVYEFIGDHLNIRPSKNSFVSRIEYINCTYDHYVPNLTVGLEHDNNKSSWNEESQGQYFTQLKGKMECNAMDNDDDFNLMNSFFTNLD